MARMQQCLTGNALEAIRGLGGTTPEYEEANEIFKSKYGGARRLLRAYMDQLDQMRSIRNNDIHALEKFADLVLITVVKLQAEGKDGELGDGTLHSVMVKKLPDRELENHSRWLNERAREKSVTVFRDWLIEEVRFRVKAAKMANGIESKTFEHVRPPRAPKYPDLGRMRNFHTSVIGNGIRNTRSPCSLCQSLDHGVWFCKQFHDKSVDDRGQFANWTPSRSMGGGTHVTMTSCNAETPTESYSLRTVPVWMKANGRKVKITAIVDDASNETFLNEEVAGGTGTARAFLESSSSCSQ